MKRFFWLVLLGLVQNVFCEICITNNTIDVKVINAAGNAGLCGGVNGIQQGNQNGGCFPVPGDFWCPSNNILVYIVNGDPTSLVSLCGIGVTVSDGGLIEVTGNLNQGYNCSVIGSTKKSAN